MNNYQKSISNQNDWSFVSCALNGFAGIVIGLIIANYLGWF
ncbi:hypothetical protein Sta7437_1709 [Stanieria cyanosphaera PCC 7437]|uniref:Uncharacterized protein n=1 Tax=Stanieria cyanosphaera (strain ATCC 29371 / PCC 7437) TaxID=111780 RepID=K9XT65_STAC7|nr:hypothetical protein Sta7437_1709 [Stanieria cyanosphaera PCC 7437]